jgi:ATP-dependent DNA helicase RecQ
MQKPFTPALLREAEAIASRLGRLLDGTGETLLRALFESGSVLSATLRSPREETASLLASALLPRTAVIVAPEVARVTDLAEQLERSGVRAALLDDPRADEPNASMLERIRGGGAKVVLATPKRLAHEGVLRALGSAGTSLVTVLEAQRLSTASPDFSPAYGRLGASLARLGRPPVFAIAPGAAGAVRHEVQEALFESPPTSFDGPLLRPNLAFSIQPGRGEVRQRAALEALRRLPRPALVFCNSPAEVESIYGALRASGLPAHRFHEDLRAGPRAAEQLEFAMPGDRRILVATSAFAPSLAASEEDSEGVPLRYGRRTTKSDIRSLVRFAPPASLEQLVEELALVGRDGEPAEALVFYDPGDRPRLEAEVVSARPNGEQLLRLGKALEATVLEGATITTEALALEARMSLRSIEALATLLGTMGLAVQRDGWLRVKAPEHALFGELRSLAERYATIRALDVRRIGEVHALSMGAGCRASALRRALGESNAAACGLCAACRSPSAEAGAPAAEGHRRPPARRFTVSAGAGEDVRAATFHTDPRHRRPTVLTAKLGEFR